MTCHKRCTYFFITLFSIIALVAMSFEVVSPTMLKENEGCYGIVFDCIKCPTIQTAASIKNCKYTVVSKYKKATENPKYFSSLVTASCAYGIVIIMTLFSFLLACGLCCSHSSWPNFISRFVVAYLVLDIFALGANIAAMALWYVMKTNQLTFMTSFWVGWAANGVLLILLIMLITLRACERRGSDSSWSSDLHRSRNETQDLDMPLFRSLYTMTASTVLGSRRK